MGIPDYDAPCNGQTAGRIQPPLVRLHERLLLEINRNRDVVHALHDLMNRILREEVEPPAPGVRGVQTFDLPLVEVLNKGPGLIEENTEAALQTISDIEKALFEPSES